MAGLATEAELKRTRRAGVLINRHGDIVEADESIKEICGRDCATLKGVPLHSLLDGRGRATLARVFVAIADAGSKVGTRIGIQHIEGDRRLVGAAVVPLDVDYAVACWW